MRKITSLQALEILDSRGNPTLQVSITTDEKVLGVAAVPSGASTGKLEAVELRDRDPSRFNGKGVQKAIKNILGPIAEVVIGQDVLNQAQIDQLMIKADGKDNKSKFGANAILGVSMAVARAGALTRGLPLYRYLGGPNAHILPCPMINIINGGIHADNSLDVQEFLIRPTGAESFSEAIRWSAEVFHALKKILKENGHATSVGDEGGFAPNLASTEAALEMIIKAIEKAGYIPGKQIALAFDLTASGFYDEKSRKYIEKKKRDAGESHLERTAEEQVKYLEALWKQYPIDSIEDGLAENDWEGWKLLTDRLGKKVQLIGDDIFVTNIKLLEKGMKLGIANSILIKLNQIGTVTETIECVKYAQSHGYSTVVSHRSGETEDTFIADLCVALNAGQIKTGSLSRSERIAKYNRLLTIEAELGKDALFQDSNPYRRRGN